ncbi:MAG: S41 family peptidase [Butyrivibrio sp.]|nr:S41 family peptidase [Acetatifactor muris]MCM1559005.1 S41 family peptidase [Butyrivibrio sp.]
MRKRLLKTGLIMIVILLFLAALLYGYYKLRMDPYRGTVAEIALSRNLEEMLSREDALDDLAYFMECLRERHPAWLDDSGKNRSAEKQYEQELAAMDMENQISVLELWQSASRIAAALHDGHTYINWYNNNYRYIDDFTAIPTYGKPLTINGIPCEDLLTAYKEVCSYETDYYVEATFWKNVIQCEQTLQLCGIDTSEGITMVFRETGAERHFDFVTLDKVTGWNPNDGTGSWVSYQIDTENSLGIFTLTSCVCDDEYYHVLDAFFKEVFANNIKNIAVDLRGNSGGNSWVANEFIRYLDVAEYRGFDSAVRYGGYLIQNKNVTYKNQKREQVFRGNLYVLTDIWTYSSAMDFAMLIADNHLGIIIGQPSGNLPDGYGDCLSFRMPHSGLAISVSYKKWYRTDQTKAGQPLFPDVETAPNEALTKLYELIQP